MIVQGQLYALTQCRVHVDCQVQICSYRKRAESPDIARRNERGAKKRGEEIVLFRLLSVTLVNAQHRAVQAHARLTRGGSRVDVDFPGANADTV